MSSILIVEDEPTIAQSLQYVLEAEGFQCHWCDLARKGISYALSECVDLVILDVGLPDISGFEACKSIREQSDVPIIFLTARSEEIDRVVGLEIGADDYVVKPFSPREVCARVKVILKRTRSKLSHSVGDDNFEHRHNAVMSMGEFSIDRLNVKIRYLNVTLPLTKAEYKIFYHLIVNPRQVFSRTQLLVAMDSPCTESYERSVDTHIKTLRAKLKKAGANVASVETVRGFGYRYEPEL